jgi:hypothetical protein
MARFNTVRPAAVLLAVLGLLVTGTTPAAAQPANDDFDSATVVTGLPFTDSRDTSDATAEPGDPDCAGNAHSVWYAFTPTQDMALLVDASGSDYDTSVSAWVGAPGGFEPRGCAQFGGRLIFDVAQGITYSLMISSFFDSPGGNLVLSVDEAPPPPPNDDFDNAVAFQDLPFEDTQNTVTATTAPDDPECAGNGHTVWYAFTPTQDMEILADTFGSDYDTTLSAWVGKRGSLERVACNDDAEGLQSRILFDVTRGTTYFLMAGSFFDSPGGNLVLTVREPPPPLQMTVRLDSTGSVSRAGVATLRGTLTCSREAAPDLLGTLRQQVGRRVAVGTFAVNDVPCLDATRWTARVVGETGTYRRGNATAVVAATVVDPERGETVRARDERVMQLR